MKLSEDDWIDRSVLYSKEIKEYKNRKLMTLPWGHHFPAKAATLRHIIQVLQGGVEAGETKLTHVLES